MDFKEIENIASQHASKADDTKQSQFEAAFKKGLLYLERTHQEGFKNAETLMTASDYLIDAITFNRTDVRPYLALAYLFSILEDFQTAEEYAFTAMKLEPENPEVTTFLDEMAAFKREIRAAAKQAGPVQLSVPDKPPPYREDTTTPDYQKLYQELETFILDKLRDLFSNPVSSEPTVDPKKYKILTKSYKSLNHVIKYIEQQIATIEKGLNASGLKEKMSPFNVLKDRYISAIQTSKSLMEINDTIELWSFKTNKQVEVVNQRLTMSALTYGRVDVNRMMDGCDLIADQLDQLSEEKDIDIALVEGSYEKLIGLVNSLNDMVDDTPSVQQNQNKLADILG